MPFGAPVDPNQSSETAIDPKALKSVIKIQHRAEAGRMGPKEDRKRGRRRPTSFEMGPKSGRRGSKGGQEGPKGVPREPKGSPRESKKGPRGAKGAQEDPKGPDLFFEVLLGAPWLPEASKYCK